MIVVDANAIIYLFHASSFTDLARGVHAKDPDWIVPELWEAEVLNGLLQEAKAGLIDLEDAILAANNAVKFLSTRVRRCDPARVLRTADEAKLSAYDAYYVTLARSMGVFLVTEDGKILKNCPDVARSLKEFLEDSGTSMVVREKPATYVTRRRKHV